MSSSRAKKTKNNATSMHIPSGMTVKQLKQERCGLPTDGMKAILVARLGEQENTTPSTTTPSTTTISTRINNEEIMRSIFSRSPPHRLSMLHCVSKWFQHVARSIDVKKLPVWGEKTLFTEQTHMHYEITVYVTVYVTSHPSRSHQRIQCSDQTHFKH